MRWVLLAVSLAVGCGPSVGAATGGGAGTGGTAGAGSSEGSDSEGWIEPPMPENCGDAVLADGWLHISADEYDERDKLDGVAVIDGDLVIRRSELTDLELLRCVREITGTLHIYDNDALVDVSGLWWVERLGGDLIVADNDALVEFDALAKVREIEREELEGLSFPLEHGLAFIRNSSLERIRGLTDLERVWGDLVIRDNPALVSLEGLLGLTTAKGAFAINHNSSLCPAAVTPIAEGLEDASEYSWSWAGNGEACPEDWPVTEPKDFCSYVQDCPAGTKCTAGSESGWNELRCVPLADDPATIGEACQVEEHFHSGRDDCERGAFCLASDNYNLEGSCLELFSFRRSSASCIDPFTAGATNGLLAVCVERCNPLAPQCDGQLKCMWRNRYPGPHRHFVCDAAWDAGPGERCGAAWECAAGTACVAEDGTPLWVTEGTCQPFCSLAEPDCPAGQTCTPWYEPEQAPPGLDDVGVCL